MNMENFHQSQSHIYNIRYENFEIDLYQNPF